MLLKNFWSLAFRNLWTRKVRTLLTTLGITLGVAAMVAIGITRESAVRSVTQVFDEASGHADLIVTDAVVKTSPKGFETDVVDQVKAVRGVEEVVPLVQAVTIPARKAADYRLSFVLGTTSGMMVFGLDPEVGLNRDYYRQIEGQPLTAHRSNERPLLLTRDYADELKVSLGDHLTMLSPDGEVRFTVTGYLAKEGLGRLNRGEIGITPLEVAQSMFGYRDEITHIDVIAKSGVDVERLRDDLRQALGKGFDISRPASKGALVDQVLQQVLLGLGFVGAITLFVGAFLIYNTFSMTLVERTREIGMLRALGSSRAQITRLMLIEALLLGALGCVLGVGFGIFLAMGMRESVTKTINTEIATLVYPMDQIAFGVLLGLVATIISAVQPARHASRISPLEALRATGSNHDGTHNRNRVWLGGAICILSVLAIGYYISNAKTLPFMLYYLAVLALLVGAVLLIPVAVPALQRVFNLPIQRIYGPPGHIGGRNVVRSPGRTALTGGALMVGLVMLVDMGTVSASGTATVRDFVDKVIAWDLFVYSPVPMDRRVGRELKAIPGINSVAMVTFVQSSLVPDDPREDELPIAFTAVEPEYYLSGEAQFIYVTDGGTRETSITRLIQGDAVLVSSVLRDRYHLKLGDTVRICTSSGIRPFEVSGVVLDFTSEGHAVTGSRRDLKRYFGVDRADVYDMSLMPGESPEKVRQTVLDSLGDRYNLRVETNAEYRGRILQLSEQFFALNNLMVVICIVVAALGVINTMTMNVLERTREIGMLRGIGMTRQQVVRMVLSEASTTGGIGGVFGFVIALLFSRTFVIAASSLSGFGLNYEFPVQATISAVGITLLVPILAAMYPAMRAGRTNIVEAIQHE